MLKKAKIIPVVLAVLLIVSGCQSLTQPSGSEDDLLTAKVKVIETPREESSFAAEKPAIDEDPLAEPASSESSSSASAESTEKPSSSSEKQQQASQSAESSKPNSLPPSSSQPPQSSQTVQSSQPEKEKEKEKPVEESSSQKEVAQSSSEPPKQTEIAEHAYKPSAVKSTGEVRAVWISYLELEPILKGKTEAQFTNSINEIFDNCSQLGLNTLIVHVRPFADALYQSSYFPWSYIATGTEGVDPGFDPLEIMVYEAHSRGLKIEAWLNPYRVRHDAKYALSKGNQAKIWLDAGSDSVASNGKGNIVFNPASELAQDLIINGIREIVRNYDVDGIHIDDYFYPTTMTDFDETFDKNSYNTYLKNGGTLSHGDWRRQNVDKLVKKMYTAIKNENPNVLFGISPQSSVANNYSKLYFDVEKALSTPGYCDYICPQIYFGYKNAAQPYAKTLATWNSMIKTSSVKLYVGLACYKIGTEDSWAGDGKYEWLNNTDIMASQILGARDTSSYAGFVLYRYDSLFKPAAAQKKYVVQELENLEDIL